MNIKDKTILVTGANRGIGASIVKELLKGGSGKIYAAARDTKSLPDFGDKRVEAVQLDITDKAQIAAAASKAADADILINNAGVAQGGSVLDGELDKIVNDMNVNYFGTLNVIRAFVPHLARKNGAAIVNIVSVLGLGNLPMIGGYSASKAALFSATQALRKDVATKNIHVMGVFPGPVDTDMAKDFPFDKANVQSVAKAIVDGLNAGKEDVFPDAMAQQVEQLWSKDPKGLEKYFASM